VGGGGEEVYVRFWWGNLRERDHLEDLGVEGRMDLQEVGCGGRTGSIWLGTETGGGFV